jgi:starch synthase
MKAAIVYSDCLTAVSPTYAQEILTPPFGSGLDGVLSTRKDALTGVLNGADYDRWDPGKDAYLPKNYTGKNFVTAKKEARKLLRRTLHMAEAQRPVLGMVGRLAHQKGVDLLVDAALRLVTMGVDLVVIGDGDRQLADQLRKLREHLPTRVGVFVGFNEKLSHLTLAASDMVLVPSRYEPCGLTQMYGMRYGAVPIVHRTGGLNDTVVDVTASPRNGTGFVFADLSTEGLIAGVKKALGYREKTPEKWQDLQRRGMAQEFSWKEAARRYIRLYEADSVVISAGNSHVRRPAVIR